MSKSNLTGGGQRDSNLELYRIIVMLAIVSHHYVVSSGLMDCINESSSIAFNSVFLLLFGCWGKIGINCFVAITGYFMCKSTITLKKLLKIVLEWLFYKYTILIIFVITGYQKLTLDGFIKAITPFRFLSYYDFTPCYIVFFLFIPFLNILIHGMNEKQHRYLLILVLVIFSLWASIPFTKVESNYIFWFMFLYLISAYIRLYPIQLFNNLKFWGWMSFAALICSYASVIFMAFIKQIFGYTNYYFFVSDSYKITALTAALCFFMFFKNIKMKYNPWINRIAASTFGVLCIHAASDEMRQWLWKDTCRNVDFYNSPYLILHAIGVVLAVYIICTIIDQLRIKFVEKTFFKFYDNVIAPKIMVQKG